MAPTIWVTYLSQIACSAVCEENTSNVCCLSLVLLATPAFVNFSALFSFNLRCSYFSALYFISIVFFFSAKSLTEKLQE